MSIKESPAVHQNGKGKGPEKGRNLKLFRSRYPKSMGKRPPLSRPTNVGRVVTQY